MDGVRRMNVQRIASRGVLFTFEEPYKTNCFLINGQNRVFLLDTFLGNQPMQDVKQYVEENELSSKPLVVFNSHADYDHYWGNGSFKSSVIVAHEACLRRMEKESEDALRNFEGDRQGKVEIVFPSLVFSDRMVFVDEGVEFYYTPGHTVDSASCFDHVDKTLFVGDNIESPVPYINELNFRTYKATLQEYLAREAKIVLCSHSDVMHDERLIKDCLDYVNRFEWQRVEVDKLDRKGKITHFMNLSNIGEKLKDRRLLKEALNYYKESIALLDQLPGDVVGRDQQRKRINDIIDSLSNIA